MLVYMCWWDHVIPTEIMLLSQYAAMNPSLGELQGPFSDILQKTAWGKDVILPQLFTENL